MKRRTNRRKGFSLLETVIAMTLIAIVFSMAITTVLAAGSIRRRSQNCRFFVTEISNYLECYRMGGSQEFADNVKTYLGVELSAAQEGSYLVYYGADYVITTAGNAAFTLTLTIAPVSAEESSFSALARDASGDVVYQTRFGFVSRYDVAVSEGGGV